MMISELLTLLPSDWKLDDVRNSECDIDSVTVGTWGGQDYYRFEANHQELAATYHVPGGWYFTFAGLPGRLLFERFEDLPLWAQAMVERTVPKPTPESKWYLN
jgi:hypothetical protein